MAKKVIFIPDNIDKCKEEIVDFVYVKGLAFSQKQKNVKSFHASIQNLYPGKKILEVSTKSDLSLGIMLSAFNLKLGDYFVESIFQSSKVFEGNVQYESIKLLSPNEARRYLKDKRTKLIKFRYNSQDFELEPKSYFYDYIYISALCEHEDLANQLLNYDIFTDIEFNEKKQINCQARACALYVFLKKNNKLSYYMSSIEKFKELYNKDVCNKQLNFFV